MKVEQVLELVKAVSDSELTEFKYEEDGVKLSLKKTSDRIVQVQAPAAPVAAPVIAPAPVPSASPHMRQNNLSGCAGWPAADGEIVLTYGGSHTAKRSCEAADLSWHERTEACST